MWQLRFRLGTTHNCRPREACGRSARWIVSEIAHGGIDVLGVADLPNDSDPPRLVQGEWPSLWVRRRWGLIGPECQQVGEGWSVAAGR